MSKELQKFSLISLSIVGVIVLFGWFAKVISLAYLAFLLLAWLIGVLSFAYLLKTSSQRPQKFVNATLATIGLKMFGSLTILLIYGVLAPKEQILPVVLGFMVAYLALTAFEVYSILPILKNQSLPQASKSKITLITVFASPQQSEVLISMLADEGFDSFLENEQGFEAAIASKDLDLQKLNKIISSQGASFNFKEIEDQNWNQLWESQISPLEVDTRLYIRADFHAPNPNFPMELVITPKMAFGSGHHQTTYMMTRYVLDNDLRAKTVLDAGCGTGILGILAKKMGASQVVCVDIEDWAVENTQENSQINGESVEIKKGTALQLNRTFDCIFANISLNAILSELSHYSAILSRDGLLFVSGFFVSDIDRLTSEAKKYGFQLQEARQKDNWAAVKFVKNPAQ